jgi:hypothetical protein
LLAAIHEVESDSIEPYLDNIHRRVCSSCERSGSEECPCPLDYLLVLLVQAIEGVDQRKAAQRNGEVETGKCAETALGCAEMARIN